MHNADWLKEQLLAERARLSQGNALPQPWAECAIITRDFARDLDNVALETWIDNLSRYMGADGAVNALDVMQRELRSRQNEERSKALGLARIAAWASVIAALLGIAGILVALVKQ